MTNTPELWRETVRLGVQALGFRIVDLGGGEVRMAAEVARHDIAAGVMTAAHAAIEMDKMISWRGEDLAAGEARRALQAAIGVSAARAELAMYRALLADVLCRAVAHDPHLALEAMALPHE